MEISKTVKIKLFDNFIIILINTISCHLFDAKKNSLHLKSEKKITKFTFASIMCFAFWTTKTARTKATFAITGIQITTIFAFIFFFTIAYVNEIVK